MSRYRRAQRPGGTFFFTVALQDRRSSLLTERIETFRAAYRSVKAELPFITVAICVLPDHLHAIWRLPIEDGDFSTRWQRIKGRFSMACAPGGLRSASKCRKGEKGIWQRRFWEHELRDADDLQRHIDYVHYNPVKHALVERVAQWPHSSFHGHVRRGVLANDWAGSTAGHERGSFGEQGGA
jgi:putative transposase